eukprot:2583734-Rhodomonas_salina.2
MEQNTKPSAVVSAGAVPICDKIVELLVFDSAGRHLFKVRAGYQGNSEARGSRKENRYSITENDRLKGLGK